MASRAAAGRWQTARVIIVDVAGGTWRRYVSSIQLESRVFVVIELGVQPSIKGDMAVGAIRGRKSRSSRRMGRVRGVLPVGCVAGYARSREPQVISRGGILMALLALHNSVRAQQRESIEVLRNRLHRNLPAQNRVALRAVGAELRAVNVRMAIRAVLSNFGENWIGVASRAGYFFVHAAQRVSRGVVIEFRNGADRGPASGGVAIFTRYIKRSVRTSTWLPLRRCGHKAGEAEKYDHEPASHLDPRVNVCTIAAIPTLICSKEEQQGRYPLGYLMLNCAQGQILDLYLMLPITIEPSGRGWGCGQIRNIELLKTYIAFSADSPIGQN
jgi:hypothetical protein